jgi:DnaJ-class molecular chaperone
VAEVLIPRHIRICPECGGSGKYAEKKVVWLGPILHRCRECSGMGFSADWEKIEREFEEMTKGGADG